MTSSNISAYPGKLRSLLAKLSREVNFGDQVFRVLTAFFAVSVILTLAGMAVQMTRSSVLSLQRFGFGFVLEQTWDPVHEVFGALPFVYGTIVSSLIALLIAVPISLGISIFLAEYSPRWLRGPCSLLVELLAAVPSVIYGLWGIFVIIPWMRTTVEPGLARLFDFLPFFQGPHQGYGMLTGGIILAIMILPTISSISREVLRVVPNLLREGSLALGATRWESIRMVVLPAAKSGIIGAIILGLGRALGETMAVTMVIGNRPQIAASLFSPSYTMASVIANEYTEATSDLYLSALSEIGLILFIVTVLLNIVARLLVWRVGRTAGGTRRA